ncbi:MAG: hypothetical protein WBB45_20455 [Cyclobacteriaceae bacterium]
MSAPESTTSAKTQLRLLGEETIYTAKGHFKACDLRRISMRFTIWLCALLNLLGVFDLGNPASRIIAAIALFGTIALLIWNEGEGKSYRQRHREAAEAYLALHKEIRYAYHTETITEEDVRVLSQKVIAQDGATRPDIPWLARKWAQKAISQHNETNNWFIQ